VRQPLRESGRIGATLLLSAIAGNGARSPAVLPELAVVRRRTVARPP